MVGLFASSRREWMPCGWLILAGANLLAPAANANENASFGQTAMVTHWSLPQATFANGFARGVALNEGSSGAIDPVASGATPRNPTRLDAAEGPSLPPENLEARGVAPYDREQPYRTPGDIKALMVAFQVLNAADAATTVVCLNRDDCHENNPIYGKRPKPIVIVGAKAAVGALHYLAMRSLAREHPGLARTLGWVSVTIQGTVVGLNLSQLF